MITTDRRARLALMLAFVLALPMLGAWKCDTSTPAPGSTKKVQPAPNPDPAPRRSGIGNVLLTFWLTQDAKRTVTSFNVGAGPQTHYCNDSCHWDATARPGQLVTSTTDYYAIGQKGHLEMQIVQGNGHLLCDADNADTGRKGGVTCTGVVRV